MSSNLSDVSPESLLMLSDLALVCGIQVERGSA